MQQLDSTLLLQHCDAMEIEGKLINKLNLDSFSANYTIF